MSVVHLETDNSQEETTPLEPLKMVNQHTRQLCEIEKCLQRSDTTLEQ